MELNKNNLSTIFVFIFVLISPYLVKWGVTIDQATFVTGMVSIVGLISTLYSANNPNTIPAFGNDEDDN